MEHNEEALVQAWHEQQPIFEQIARVGFQKYAEGLVDIKQAFELTDHSLRCMDEGTPHGIHMAGSGILSKELAMKVVAEAQVNGIYSHAGCGAAALYVKQNELSVEDPDKVGIDWARELAERSGVPYLGHIGFEEMSRPSGFHVARVAYMDGTGRFDPARVPGLPPGFVVGRKHFSPEYAAQELQIAASIAMGGHGFGERITPEHPFMVVTINHDERGQAELMSEARSAFGTNDKISVQSFTY